MKNNTVQTLKIYWQHLKKFKVSFFITCFSVITAALVNTIKPLYYKDFFDTLTNTVDKEVGFKALLLILLMIAVLNFIEWCLWRLSTFIAVRYYTGVMANLHNTCFKYLHKHSIGYFENTFVGSLVKKANKFVWAFNNISDVVIWNLLTLLTNIIFISYILVSKNTILGLIVIVWTVMFLCINGIFTKYKLKYDILQSKADTEISRILADTVTNQSNVKFFNGYEREVNFFAKATETAKKLRSFAWNLDNIFEAIQTLLMVGLELGIFYFGMTLWKKGIFTIGDFILLQSYALMIFHKVWGFGRTIRAIYQNLSDAEEMTEILLTPHSIRDSSNAKELIVKKGNIEFKDTTFCYNNTRCILKKLNLKIKAGEKIALVGPSGAGKSTIIKLLLRMYDVTGGKVMIDGQQIKKATQESVWRAVSMVPQDPILFHRSLKENIRYGKPDATDEEVFEASTMAHCHEFISEFEEGYETKVGERGIKLSGGERQRVAIARAILRNSPILVLDEATSSLDSESEYLIQDALDTLMKKKTVIVIAHRLSTIMKVDRIMVIDRGMIIEQGKHSILIKKKGGLYKKLWDIQAGGFIK